MRLLKWLPVCLVSGYVIVACGGESFTAGSSGGGNGTAGGASAAGGASGGAQTNGGTRASGGAPTAGSPSSGGSASGGALGSGGALTSGGTKAAGGSAAGGHPNAGGTKATGGTSGAGGQTFDSCSSSGECTLVPAACCGACNPQLSDYVALNSSQVNAYLSQRACTDIACAPCPAPLPQADASGNFGALCVSGRCQAFDVRSSPLSRCEKSTDCALRMGVSCCEGCGGGLAAVSTQLDLQKQLCGDGGFACPACAPIYPAAASAQCGTDGHCAVSWLTQ